MTFSPELREWSFGSATLATILLCWPFHAGAQDNFEAVVAAVIEERGVDASFVLYDERSDRFRWFNQPRAQRAMLPASTFKILNSLIILETGVIDSVDTVIEWDGRERGYASWNRDQTLRSAYRYSTVWAYQALARDVGLERMQAFIDATGYGNARIGDAVDRFWLEGPMRVTSQQQIELLRRLRSGDLPFAKTTLDAVREIMIADEGDGFVLRAKTGWATLPDPDIGWYVGYLETPENTWYFALNVDIYDDGRGRDRTGIARDILERLGLLPGE